MILYTAILLAIVAGILIHKWEHRTGRSRWEGLP